MSAAANRDPEVFEEPDRFDIRRIQSKAMSFSGGIHFCQGAFLGKRELRVVFAAMLERYPDIRLASDKPAWRHSLTFRGLAELPVVLDRTA